MRLGSILCATAVLTGVAAAEAGAIPAWARKYNMNCSGCHYPAPPRLNATGIRFRWAGYRMPEEMGEQVDVAQITNYIAGNGQVVFSFEKTSGETSQNAFGVGDATLFYSGPFGKHYFAWTEFNHPPEGGVEIVAQVGGVWGRGASFGGFRAGPGHMLYETGIAGFDREVSLSTPMAIEEPLTAGVPFAFADGRVGAEAFWVRSRNRLSAQVLNPITSVGPDNHKDLVVTDQLLLDRHGSGIQLMGIYGTMLGADPGAADTRSNYYRLAASASYWISNFAIVGGLAYGQDRDLPIGGGSPFATDKIKGNGYWVSGQYYIPRSSLAVYGRFEHADPNTSAADDAATQYVLGGIVPLTLPEYLRLNLEWALRKPQAPGAGSTNSLSAALSLTF